MERVAQAAAAFGALASFYFAVGLVNAFLQSQWAVMNGEPRPAETIKNLATLLLICLIVTLFAASIASRVAGILLPAVGG